MMNTAMRRLILNCAIVVLAACGSAQAQKKPIVIIGPPVPFDQTLSIEDDANGSFLVFDTGSGKYTFTRCSDGLKISGVGFVKVDGCSISLEDNQADHRVVASVNECSQDGKALVEKFASGDVAAFKAVLGDVNMGNNLLDCAPKK